MIVNLSPTESQILTDLRTFLLSILPAGVEVILAQQNRVPEPQVADFVVMTPTYRLRLATNRNAYQDSAFTGSIAGNVLTVTAIRKGSVIVGNPLTGLGVAAATKITSQLTGSPGGIGTYVVSPGAQTVTSTLMQNGSKDAMQETRIDVQLDVHGPASGNNSQIISTLFRDEVAVAFFRSLAHGVWPLYADDPRQLPFQNEEQQIEYRWVIEARLQANPVASTAQQFADEIDVTVRSVEADFPASL